MHDHIQNILKIIQDKMDLNRKEDFTDYSDPNFLLSEIQKEIEEVRSELKDNNSIYLEDELGDILWDYLYVLVNLQNKEYISIEKVFERCEKKYKERFEGIRDGKTWNEVKTVQKKNLLDEHNKKYN